ncbi:AAA family ATPase [Gaiella occulta]|uniref:AAA family ATPase n=1 Tax=Gaiella occulta TaxID=1002870 RepID=UPI000E0C8265|nr:ATP-binding protein [Gaiella occulta]
MNPPVVVISGPPASGKTTVADFLATEVGLPLIARDEIKELVLDLLGAGDVAWSKRIGGVSYELLYQAVERELRVGRSFIVESNFPSVYGRTRLLELRERYSYQPLEIHCTASKETLIGRYRARASTRHPGHNDVDRVGEVEAAVDGGTHRQLQLGGGVIVLDTTDGEAIGLDAVLAAVRDHLADDRPT